MIPAHRLVLDVLMIGQFVSACAFAPRACSGEREAGPGKGEDTPALSASSRQEREREAMEVASRREKVLVQLRERVKTEKKNIGSKTTIDESSSLALEIWLLGVYRDEAAAGLLCECIGLRLTTERLNAMDNPTGRPLEPFQVQFSGWPLDRQYPAVTTLSNIGVPALKYVVEHYRKVADNNDEEATRCIWIVLNVSQDGALFDPAEFLSRQLGSVLSVEKARGIVDKARKAKIPIVSHPADSRPGLVPTNLLRGKGTAAPQEEAGEKGEKDAKEAPPGGVR